MLAAVLTRADFGAAGGDDTEGIVEIMRGVRGIKAAALVSEAGPDGAYRVSLRSVDPDVDVSAIARDEGGGGHRAAAGFSTRRPPEDLLAWLDAAMTDAGLRRRTEPVAEAVAAALWLVDKPAGPTSHDVVAGVRRRLGRKAKVGHTGTLDPFATGLLVLMVGRATRLAPLLTGLDKTYLATLRTGFASESGDPEGPVSRAGEPADADAIAAVLPGLRGRPAPARAGAVGGEASAASGSTPRTRRGEETELPEREIAVRDLRLVEDLGDGEAVLEVRCSAGTYVRRLASRHRRAPRLRRLPHGAAPHGGGEPLGRRRRGARGGGPRGRASRR